MGGDSNDKNKCTYIQHTYENLETLQAEMLMGQVVID